MALVCSLVSTFEHNLLLTLKYVFREYRTDCHCLLFEIAPVLEDMRD